MVTFSYSALRKTLFAIMASRKSQLALQALNELPSKEYKHRLPLEPAMEQIIKADEPFSFSIAGRL